MTTAILDNLSNNYDAFSPVDVVYGLDGNDILDTNSSSTSYTLYGGNGNDAMRGFNAVDYLFGGKGNDVLVGYAGKDYLDGGPGNDQFWFDRDGGNPGKDKIVDFHVGEDLLGFDNGAFAGLGPDGVLKAKKFYIGHHAHDGNDRVIYNADKGKLLYDRNGDHSGHEIVVATLAKHLHLTHHDVIVGDIDLLFV